VAGVFDQLAWDGSTARLGDTTFDVEAAGTTERQFGDNCFRLYKTKGFLNSYARFWSAHPVFPVRNMIELGAWDGGSAALWFEHFHPAKLVTVDVMPDGDSPYFVEWRARRGVEDRVRTYWSTDQSDRSRLAEIVAAEFGQDDLDLVIDDASHQYAPTKASFETLFPMLRPGGLYIIEDWATDHHAGAGSLDPADQVLGSLVHQLVGAVASVNRLVRDVTLYRGMAVIERGGADRSELQHLRLEDYIQDRRPDGVAPRPGDRSLFASTRNRAVKLTRRH
jgi:predicted O-methyltransferase YrrM